MNTNQKKYNIERFYGEHRRWYGTALQEIRNGQKISHWIWFIFPQLSFLGRSNTAVYYGIESAEEARQYYNDEYLGKSLREITAALLKCEATDPVEVMGRPDDLKLRSSMTLFYEVTGDKLFADVLEKFYEGKGDMATLSFLGKGR